jgi:serine protease Do
VGINSKIYSNSGGFMGVSFAIPIDIAIDVAEQLKANGRVSRGWLGVVIQEVNRDLAESFGLVRPHGALVSRVLDGSPAETGGILEGDIITSFNGRSIDRSSELPHFVGRARAGTQARLNIVREGKELELELKIGELADRGEEQFGSAREGDEGPSRLGLVVETITAEDEQRLGIDGGVRVVEANGIAQESGLREGDVITKLDNKAVRDISAFADIAAGLTPGRSVAVLVIRRQNPIFLALRVPD